MEIIIPNWKSNVVFQLKQHNHQQNGYEHLIQHYNRLLENNFVLKNECRKFEKNVNQLRLANAGLEKASEASQELANVNSKLTEVNEELMQHLREKGELAREVLRLNHALTDLNDKFLSEEIKTKQYKIENDELHEKLSRAELEINDLLQINTVLREEFQAVRTEINQLQKEYNQMKPAYLEFEQQLESAKRMNQRLEDELVYYKNKQADIHNYESEIFSHQISKRMETAKANESNIFLDDDLVIIPSLNSSNSSQDILTNSEYGSNTDVMHSSYNESLSRDRRSSFAGNNLFASIIRKLKPDMTNNSTYDRMNRTSTCCVTALVPTREVNHWDCTDLEVYTLQFQPSGSILATGGSDQMIHLWEISANGQQNKYCSLQGSQGAINAIDFDNEGCRLLVGCSGQKAYIWSYGEYRMLKDTYTGHQGSIAACKFISGTKFATGSADRTIKVWDLHGRQCIRTLLPGSKCHDLVVIDAAGTIISGHFDKKIRIWDALKDKCRTELKYDASITSLSYNDDRQQLLACFKDDTLKLIDLRQNRTLYTFSHDHFKVSTDTTKAILSPDGRYICAGSHDGSLVVWNTETRSCENVLKQRHSTMVTCVAWRPDGKYVASCEKHRRVILWSQ